jgi:hypothetical protein
MNKPVKIEMPGDIDLAQSKERIASYHENGWRSAQQQFGYQFLAGVELHRAKAALAHGQFGKWIEENFSSGPCPLTDRTAQRYMKFAEELISKSKTVADLSAKPLQITNGEIPEKQKKAILDAVFEFADGKSVTEMMRDLGIIRPAKKQEYTAPKELTADEQAKAEEEQAHELIQAAIVALRCTLDDKTKADSKRPDRKELIDICIEVSKAYKGIERHVRAVRTGRPAASKHKSK